MFSYLDIFEGDNLNANDCIYIYIYKRDSFGLRNAKECSMTYRQSEKYKMPQKLTTTGCFIQEQFSGGKQFRKHVCCSYAQGGNVGVLSFKKHAFLSLFRFFT